MLFNVLLIGDSCIDVYMTGSVDRLSPEAPVPVLKNIDETRLPGMAANVKLNLERFGLFVDFITNTSLITKTRYIDKKSGQQLLRVDNEPVTVPWHQTYYSTNYDALVISDYNKGFLSYEHIEHCILKFKCPIFIDTKKTDLRRFNADHVMIKINEHEYNQCSSIPDYLIVTKGSEGAMLKKLDQERVIPTKPVAVTDVCGCGDTFLSALTYSFLLTGKLEESIVFANQAAGITAQRRGNYAPTLEEIQNAKH